MKEKRNITIIDKKQIPSDEPARQYYFMDIAKKYVAELAEQKGAPLTFCVTTFGCQMNARDSEKLVGILEKIGMWKHRMKRPILSFIIPVLFVRMPIIRFTADLVTYMALRKRTHI